MKLKYILPIGALFSLASQSANAQLKDSTIAKMMSQVQITANRLPETQFNSVGNTTVIKSEEIHKMGYQNIGELISSLAGFNSIGTNQNPGSVVTPYLRGTNSNQLLVMIDGIRITDPASPDNSLNLAELSLANIDRIEIVRGSSGTVYGTSAMGGVLNIYTKSPTKSGIVTNAGITGSAFGKGMSLTTNAAVGYQLKSGLYARIEGSKISSTGFNSTIDTIKSGFKSQKLNDDFYKDEFHAKVGYKTEKWNTFIQLKANHQKADIDNGAFIDDDNNYIEQWRNTFNYSLSRKINKITTLRWNGGYNSYKRVNENDSSLIASGVFNGNYFFGKYLGTTFQNELQAEVNSRFGMLVAGVTNYSETFSQNSSYFSSGFNYQSTTNYDTLNIKSAIKGVFANAVIDGKYFSSDLKNLKLNIGSRFSNHSNFGNNVSYNIAPSYLFDNNLLLFAKYATGFNAPALYRLYAPERDFSSGISLGNSSLKPEVATSKELGFKYNFSRYILANITGFQINTQNPIQYVYLWNNKPSDSLTYLDYMGSTYLNLGNSQSKGVELDLVIKPFKKLTILFNHTFYNTKFEAGPEMYNSGQVNNLLVQSYDDGQFLNKEYSINTLSRRYKTWNTSFNYELIKDFNVIFKIRHTGTKFDVFYDGSAGPFGALGRTKLNSYTLYDFCLNYNIGKVWLIQFQSNNIMNKKYSEIIGFNTLPRTINASIFFNL